MRIINLLTAMTRAYSVYSGVQGFQLIHFNRTIGLMKFLHYSTADRKDLEENKLENTKTKKNTGDSTPEVKLGIIPPEKTEEVLNFLYSYQLRDTFLWKQVEACPLGYRIPIYDVSMKKIIKQGVSVMAEEEGTNKLLGVLISRIVSRNYNPILEIDEENKGMDIPERLQMVIGILQDVSNKFDTFEEYKLDQLIYMQHLCVHREYRGTGVRQLLHKIFAKTLYNTGIPVIEGMGSKGYLDMEDTRGRKTVSETKYSDFTFGGKVVYKGYGAHTMVQKAVTKVKPDVIKIKYNF